MRNKLRREKERSQEAFETGYNLHRQSLECMLCMLDRIHLELVIDWNKPNYFMQSALPWILCYDNQWVKFDRI